MIRTGFSFRPGLYRHYKGGLYIALFLCSHHETGETFVAYVSQEHLDSGVRLREWCSPGKDSWTDDVDGGDAGLVPRFAWVGP